MVQRIMNTVEKTSTGVSPVELMLNNSIRLSNRILATGSANPTSQVALSDTMDNWVARQYTLLQVAQAHQHQSDSHLLVEYDPRITEYPIHSYVLFTPPIGRGNKLLPSHNRSSSVGQADQFTYPQPSSVDCSSTQSSLSRSLDTAATAIDDPHCNSTSDGLDSTILATAGNRTRPSCMWTSSMITYAPTP